jgi:hypothetical protein
MLWFAFARFFLNIGRKEEAGQLGNLNATPGCAARCIEYFKAGGSTEHFESVSGA